MSDSSCNTPPESSVNTSTAEDVDYDLNNSDPVSSSFDSRVDSEKVSPGDIYVSCKNQPPQSNRECFCEDALVSSTTDDTNGDPDVHTNKTNSFLRPSSLSGASNLAIGGNSATQSVESQSTAKCPLKSPKLNLPPSKFGNTDGFSIVTSVSKLPFQQSKNPFTNAVSFENDNNESSLTSNNVQNEVNTSGDSAGEKLSKPVFSSFSNNKPKGSTNNSSSILVPDFVFGQNLHERVADGITTPNNKDKKNAEAANSNGTSDMLFTSVLTSREIKENFSNDMPVNAREPFSLIEDAARCQEARANKRKYEEVLVTTGEEDEENVLQVNVKLFAFDSGTWVERGRGILRLNDKYCDETIVSRIVIRTLGSLRVVLNTKIWSGMSLNRASDRSVRITAMDPNGQLKIFLIQASPKDMGVLFHYLDMRLKRCQENQGGPEKRRAEESDDDIASQELKT